MVRDTGFEPPPAALRAAMRAGVTIRTCQDGHSNIDGHTRF